MKSFLTCLALLLVLATEPLFSATAPSSEAQLKETLAAIQATLDKNENTTALEMAKRAVRNFPLASDAYRYRALAIRMTGDPKAALADYSKAIELDPKNVRAWNGRAQCRYSIKEHEAALSDFNQALKLDPTHALAYDSRALLKRDMGDLKGALTDTNKAIALKGTNPGYIYHRACVYQSLKDWKNVESDCNAALRLDSNYGDAYYGRALARASQGNHEGAIADYSRCIADGFRAQDARANLAKSEKALAVDKDNQAAEQEAPSAAKSGGKAKKVASPSEESRKTSTIATKAGPKNASAPATPKAEEEPKPQPEKPAAPKQTPAKPAKMVQAPAEEKRVEPESGMGYYKLVGIEMPYTATNGPDYSATQTVSYGPKSTSSSVISSSTDKETKSTWTYKLNWSVPERIIPGVRHRVRISGDASPDSFIDAYIQLAGSPDDRWGLYLAGVRVRNDPRPAAGELPPNVPSDEFDFGIPKELNEWRKAHAATNAERKRFDVSMRVRSNEFEDMVHSHNGSADIFKTPNELELVDAKSNIVNWADPVTGPIDITLKVATGIQPLAIYTYKWEAPEESLGQIEIVTEPASKKELRVDGRDSLVLKARHVPLDKSKAAESKRLTQALSFAGVGTGMEWVDISDVRIIGDWACVTVQASNPDPVQGKANTPPESLGLRARVKDGKKSYSNTLQLKVAPDAEIGVKPDLIEFTAFSGKTGQAKVTITNPGPEPWKIRWELDKNSRPLANVDFKQSNGSSALINLKEAGLDLLHNGFNTEYATLKIFAEQKGRDTLECVFKVRIAQEGLFVASTGRSPMDGLFKVYADGKGEPTDIDFQVFEQDPKTNLIVNRMAKAGTLKNITIECLEIKESIASRLMESGKFSFKVAGTRPLNEPTGILRMSFAKELPSDGRVIPCDFRIRYTAREEQSFSAIVTIGIVTTGNGPGGSDWKIELERCEQIINKFVPVAYRAQLHAMLERRKMTLGPEGLHELRRKIWNAAANLTLGEGGQGYADEARWAGYITDCLEWSQWAGDMAFDAVVSTYVGPFGAGATSMLKNLLISAINAYQEGQSAEDWLWDNLYSIPNIIEGKVIDPDMFEKWGVETRAKAWAIFVSYHFLKNLWNGESVIDALKNTAKEVGKNVLSNWLNEEVKKNKNRSVSDWASEKVTGPKPPAPKPYTPPPPVIAGKKPEDTSQQQVDHIKQLEDVRPGESADGPSGKVPSEPSEIDAVNLVRKNTVVTANGKRYANIKDTLEIMSDPSMVRSLKNAPEDAQEAFSNTRERIYKEHDLELVQHVKKNVPGMDCRLVKVLEFRTPGATGPSLNTDRDYRVCYYAGRDPHSGKEQWIEVPRKQWQDKSYRTFAKLTGGPTDSAHEAEEWAAKHQQLGTDRGHVEASPSFSDQKTVWNPTTKKFDKIQVTSNFVRVTKFQQEGVDVNDPSALGRMYEVKVNDARFKHEAFVQANKAVGALQSLRKSYEAQKRDIGQLPKKLQNGMDAVVEVNKKLAADPNRRDPKAIEEVESKLRENGFRGLDDFMNKMSSQFETFKLVDEPKK